MSIHPSAIVSSAAKIGRNVSIGPFTIVYENVSIGDNTSIGSHSVIGLPTPLAKHGPMLVIGSDSLIRSHGIFYEGSILGNRLTTGHRVTVRENTQAGENFQLGTLTNIQGDCVIGDYVRTHNNVNISKFSKIGSFVWMFPYVVLTNDPHPPSNVEMGSTIGDYAIIASKSLLLPGVVVGEHSLVAANSTVSRNVEPHTVVRGSPAKFVCETKEIKLRDGTNRPAYPWPTHFRRGYPDTVLVQWNEQFADQP
jgi:acyl-[acyl carrier protein]--UDP-N-acetylglucosamine O-acyltransferase